MPAEEDCRVGSKHLRVLSFRLLSNPHFVALPGVGERLGCTHHQRRRCYVGVLLLMTDFEVCDNSGSLHVDTVAAALVAVQSAGNNAQAVSAGSK